jgi:hypothetical protein
VTIEHCIAGHYHDYIVCLMAFDATFNNISVISWRSVLLVEENTGGRRGRDRTVVGFSPTYAIGAYQH